MQEQINQIKETQRRQGEMITKIYEGVIGNDFSEGILSDVKRNTRHRKNSVKTHGFIAGAAIVFGGLLGKFWDGILNILHL
jgi:hypothetical protein